MLRIFSTVIMVVDSLYDCGTRSPNRHRNAIVDFSQVSPLQKQDVISAEHIHTRNSRGAYLHPIQELRPLGLGLEFRV